MTAAIAPIADRIIQIPERLLSEDGWGLNPAWIVYFEQLYRGDGGTTWTPVITNLTTVGTPTITGVYYQNGGFTDFAVKIVPGTNTSSVLGTTTIALPFTVTADTVATAINGFNVLQGVVNASGRVIYLPTWSVVAVPITITGRVKN